MTPNSIRKTTEIFQSLLKQDEDSELSEVLSNDHWLYAANGYCLVRVKTPKRNARYGDEKAVTGVVSVAEQAEANSKRLISQGKGIIWEVCLDDLWELDLDVCSTIKTPGGAIVALDLMKELLLVFKKIKFITDPENPLLPIWFLAKGFEYKEVFGKHFPTCEGLLMPIKPTFHADRAYHCWSRDSDGVYSIKRLFPAKDYSMAGSRELQTGLFLSKFDAAGHYMNGYVCDDCEKDNLPHGVIKNVPHGDGTTRMECTNCHRWSGPFVPAEY